MRIVVVTGLVVIAVGLVIAPKPAFSDSICLAYEQVKMPVVPAIQTTKGYPRQD